MTTPEAGLRTRVETQAEDQAVVVGIVGDVDQSTSEALDKALDEGVAKAKESGALLVVVDLQEVGFVASAGLSSLIKAHNRARDEGLELVVVLPEEHRLARLLWLTALSRVLTVVSSLEEALTKAPRNPA
ncbi:MULTISPECIES: STAS domain-containing protein [Saccharothrix]|uniref:Anti-sigma factor antagonist n=1 Tax=Saccharothrix longispora TaxID=33920 RepID=A0ABU1PXL7_9PSEU|nr:MULTISPECIES: STAS domain-containing protein [Saccharothrix]MDR6594879.1 anti-anti-sigma factor [Saccharothrix longispora]